MKRFLCILFCLLLTLTLPAAALCGCAAEPVTQSGVTSVVYNEKKARLEVSCAFAEDALKGRSRRVCLFALPPDRQSDTFDLSGMTPVAEAMPKQRITFYVPLGSGQEDRLFAAYLPALYDKGTDTYTPICLPGSLRSATGMTENAESGSVKGLALNGEADYDGDALRLGVSSVVIPVRIDRLVPAAWEEGAVPYLWNGTTRYLRGDVLDELDARIDVFTRTGTRVYLRLMLGYDSTMPAPACLYCPGVTLREGGSYAVCTDTPEAVDLLEGLITELVRRYAPDGSSVGRGLCRDFIMGEAVNDPARWEGGTNAGADSEADSEKIAAAYATLLRIADTALSLFAPRGGVFADLLVGDSYQSFLVSVADAAAAKGDFNWNLSARIEAASTAIWVNEPQPAQNGLRYPHDLLSVSTRSMRQSEDGTRRRIAVTLTVPGTEEAGQAASYAWAYLAMTSSEAVDALFWGDHVSGQTTALRALRPDGSTSAREVYNMLAVADTNRADSRFAVARQMVGQSFADLETRMTDRTPPVTRIDTAASAVPKLPAGADALIAFDGGEMPFSDGGLLSHCELTRVDGTVRLSAAFAPTRRGAPAGITTVLSPGSLKGVTALYLPMTVFTADASPVTVTVTVRRPAGTSGDCLLYTASQTGVTSGTPFILSCALADFTKQLDKKDACVLSVTVEPTSDSPVECRLMPESVYTTGALHGLPKGLLVSIWVAVGAAAVVGLSALLFSRSKNKRNRY